MANTSLEPTNGQDNTPKSSEDLAPKSTEKQKSPLISQQLKLINLTKNWLLLIKLYLQAELQNTTQTWHRP